MRIVIPSRGRHDEVACLPYITPRLLERTSIVVPRREVRRYRKRYSVPVIACPAEGIAATRQWIIESSNDDHVFMVDDDARFFHRPDMSSAKLYPLENPDAMWRDVENAFNRGFPWVGISYRGGNNFSKEAERTCTKSFSVWGVNRNVLLREDIRFDRTRVMEDFQVILSLLTRGYENLVFFKYAWDQKSSNASGGCSEYRTPEVNAESAHQLHAMFPDFVKVVTKNPKSGWYDGKPRVDVNIQWQKAYRSSIPW